MQKTLGGDRLGSGNKMKVHLHNYGRSTHNLSRAWRSSMTCGTLVPFLVEPALNGDTWNIDISGLVRTHPTIGPMFGSFKMQMDIFVAPMRLYNKQLHNNKLGIGMDMSRVKFPKIHLITPNIQGGPNATTSSQVSTSSLLAYLGIRGNGSVKGEPGDIATEVRGFHEATPLLAYWDIFKNYYANKQEENAYVIEGRKREISFLLSAYDPNSHFTKYRSQDPEGKIELSPAINGQQWFLLGNNLIAENIWLSQLNMQNGQTEITKLSETSGVGTTHINTNTLQIEFYANFFNVKVWTDARDFRNLITPRITPFPLKNIDDTREDLLSAPSQVPFLIQAATRSPYNACLKNASLNQEDVYWTGAIGELSGLAVKTYQADRFNAWLSTEWIEGANGIAEITAVDTSSGSFTMDTLNLAKKVYNMLNRIAVSGGSYHDWQEAVWGEKISHMAETPWFAGGTSQEITFSEVTSTAEAGGENPLGTLAGKGYSKHSSKRINIKIQEPSYIIGILSITPRVDYSQGNKWFTQLDTMNDLHKPELSGIGFQELPTWELNAAAMRKNPDNTIIHESIGKQPAWIHYMTALNETYGTFAEPFQEMYMTLNRNYGTSMWIDTLETYENFGKIADATTYINPEKFNKNFAGTSLRNQNFWVQLGMDITARRKMSAKQIPNM